MTETLSIEFGALCDPISQQLDDGNWSRFIYDDDLGLIDQMDENINLLRLQHILTECEANRARMRVIKFIKKCMSEVVE